MDIETTELFKNPFPNRSANQVGQEINERYNTACAQTILDINQKRAQYIQYRAIVNGDAHKQCMRMLAQEKMRADMVMTHAIKTLPDQLWSRDEYSGINTFIQTKSHIGELPNTHAMEDIEHMRYHQQLMKELTHLDASEAVQTAIVACWFGYVAHQLSENEFLHYDTMTTGYHQHLIETYNHCPSIDEIKQHLHQYTPGALGNVTYTELRIQLSCLLLTHALFHRNLTQAVTIIEDALPHIKSDDLRYVTFHYLRAECMRGNKQA